MDRDSAVAIVKRRLNFRSDKDAEIVSALQLEQIRLEQRPNLPWFLRTEIATATTTDGEERVEIPNGFIREVEDDALWYFNASATDPADVWKPLAKGETDRLRCEYPGEGTPEAYSLDDIYFRIFPTPNGAYTLKHVFFKKDAVLSSNIENLWLLHVPNLMIGRAGLEIAEDLRNPTATQAFSTMIAEGEQLLSRNIVARRNANRRYQIGGPD